jgi:Holliday junction resolvase-like predicted endonuclease
MSGLTAIELGALGEDLAVGFLERRGMCIVERNAFVDRDEIDIVYRSESRLVAVEVKTSSTGADPFDALDDIKMHRFLRAANGYRLPISDVDAISVMIGFRGVKIRWLRAIGSP